MTSTIQHLRSNTPGKKPTAGQLASGQIAINTADGKLFIKKDNNQVADITKQIFQNNTSVVVNDAGTSIAVTVEDTNKITINGSAVTFDTPIVLNNTDTIKFNDQGNNSYIAVQAPNSVDHSYIIKLPPSQPISNTVLGNDGNGNTTWSRTDTFGGNRIYVSDTYGDDSMDGVSAPVKTLKRGCQLAASLGQQPKVDPGVDFYNAKRIIEDNRAFIQAEARSFIEVTTGYDETVCRRDVGYIVDAAYYDIALGTNYNTVTTGLSYQRTDTHNIRGAQYIQTINALTYIKSQIHVSTQSNSTAQTRGDAVLDEVTDILQNGTSAANALVFPTPTGAASAIINAKNQLSQNKAFIKAEIVAYVNANSPPSGYSQSACSRDVGYIVDALCYDILYGGNSAIIKNAIAYFSYGISQIGSNETTATVNAYTRLQSIVSSIVQGNAITKTSGNAETQILTGGNATSTEATALSNLIAVIKNVITAGNINSLPSVTNPSIAWAASGIVSACAQLATDKPNIINTTIANLYTNYTAKCNRDIGLLVDAVVYDMILGGNRRTTESAQYVHNVYNVITYQKTQSLAAMGFVRDLVLNLIQQLPITPYQNILTETLHSNFYGTGAVSKITTLFNSMISIFDTGTIPTIVQPSFSTIPVTVMVSAGDFYVDNPIIIPDKVSIVGDSLRSVVIRPMNANKDLFRVRNGAYLTGFTFRDGLNANDIPTYTWNWAVAFDDPTDTSVDRSGYFGLSYDKPTITLSPFFQNTSLISFLGGNGVLVDGSLVVTPNIPTNLIELENPIDLSDGVPEQGKSMIANAFTMISFGGTGWLLRNDAYAQIVSCFQIFMLNGSYCQSGGYMSITNSATNFGVYALRSSGYSANSFTFDRGFIANSGTENGVPTLTSIGTKRVPVNQYIIRIKDPATNLDITNNFKQSNHTVSVNAATDINATTGVFTVSSHGFANGDSVYYYNNGNTDIPGMYDHSIYFVNVLTSSTFALYHDNSMSFKVVNIGVGTGTHLLVSNVEEYTVGDILESHSTYQELTLTAGVYSIYSGQTITGSTGGYTNTAYVYSYDSVTHKLIVSVEYTFVNGNLQRISFNNTSSITKIGATTVNIVVTAVTDINNVYYTARFKAVSTVTGNVLQNQMNSLLKNVNFHRPSIVNSSAHTWEYAGSGTDYNALPQNGGYGITSHEQYSELPGRVYTSGTNELGDFKVGDFIIAENKTGNILFRTKVTVGELAVLRLSLSNIEVTQFSNDPGLGDNEPGGASDSRLSTQKAIRTFVANRLGKVLDKDVSTNAVPGAVVQLNSQGQINTDLLPPSRGVTTYNVSTWGGRLTLSEQVPSIQVISGDNASETYYQQVITLNSSVTVYKGDIITQSNTTAYGVIKADYVGQNLTIANIINTWDTTNTIKVNGVVKAGVIPTIISTPVTIVENYYLKLDTYGQYLDLDPVRTYNFTGITHVTGANSGAQGLILSGPIYGVVYNLDATSLVGGTGYTPAIGTTIYYDVPITGGSGSGAKANITVSNGSVTTVDLTFGGSGYAVNNTISASYTNLGGTTTSAFNIKVSSTNTRLYVALEGSFLKFSATGTSPEYVESNDARTVSISNLAAANQKTFDARDVTLGGDMYYAQDRIHIASHGFVDGDALVYNNGGNLSIGNFINLKTYWVKVIDSDTIELYNNYGFTSGSKLIFGSTASGIHSLTVYTVGTQNNTFNVPGHAFTSGQPVRFTAAVTPTGINDNGYYYVGSITTNGFTLHYNQTEASSSINGVTISAVAITTTGSGSAAFITQDVRIVSTINTSSSIESNWAAQALSTFDASNIVSGVISPSRLAAVGNATDKTFLRGDSTWATVLQNIKPATSSAISITGDFDTVSGTNYYYNSATIDVSLASTGNSDPDYSSIGVLALSKSQFTITSGKAVIKGNVIDAGTLGGNAPSYYTNPANLVGAVPVNKGGTGLTTFTKGDIVYSGSNGSLNQLAIGSANSLLTSDGLTPSWSTSITLSGSLNVGSLIVDSMLVFDTVTTTTTSVSVDQVIASFDATLYRTAKVVVQAVDATATKYHSTEFLIINGNSLIQFTEYSSVYVTGQCASFNVDLNAGNMRILATPASTNSTVFKVAAQLTKI